MKPHRSDRVRPKSNGYISYIIYIYIIIYTVIYAHHACKSCHNWGASPIFHTLLGTFFGHLILQLFPKDRGRFVGEAIDPGGQGTFVGQVSERSGATLVAMQLWQLWLGTESPRWWQATSSTHALTWDGNRTWPSWPAPRPRDSALVLALSTSNEARMKNQSLAPAESGQPHQPATWSEWLQGSILWRIALAAGDGSVWLVPLECFIVASCEPFFRDLSWNFTLW
jgi:hypothetical protein